MDMTRTELLPGVWLTLLRAAEGQTAWLSLNLLAQRRRETAAYHALLPRVLCRGTNRYADAAVLAAYMRQIGVTVTPLARQIGEMQSLGFFASLDAGEEALRACCELLGELLLHPVTRGGLLLPRLVDEEREALTQELAARDADPDSRALRRCIEEMCCCEDYAVDFGEELESVRYTGLTKQYRALLPTSPIEIICCCRTDRRQLVRWLSDALAGLPRGELDEELGADLRLNALEAQPRRLAEEAALDGQSRLVVGFRLGECMEDPDEASLLVFERLLRTELTKRLPPDARAQTLLDADKGVLLVMAAVPEETLAHTEEALFRLLATSGENVPEEASRLAACDREASRLRALDGAAQEDLLLRLLTRGLDCDAQTLAALCEDITGEALRDLARSLDCDFIYTLHDAAVEEDEGGGDHGSDIS